jgi:hypothetical protein
MNWWRRKGTWIWRVTACQCPFCNRRLDVGVPSDGASQPKEDDISVCGYCGEVLFYRADLTLRKPNPNEVTVMTLADPELGHYLAKTQAYFRRPEA